MIGALHWERSAQTAHNAPMAARAPCMALAVSADPFRRTTTRSKRGSFKRLSIVRRCLEHLPVRFPNLARKSASTSATAGVGPCNMCPPYAHSVEVWNHGLSQFRRPVYGYFPRQSVALKRVQRRGCSPEQLQRSFSVALGKRRQPLPAVVIFASLKSPSRQKQPQPVGKITVGGGLHLKALGCTPSVGASQP